MFKKVTIAISLFLLLNGLLLIFNSLKLPIYQVKEAIKLGGEFVPGENISVSNVLPDSPAEKEGLQKGDIILLVNGKKISDVLDFIDEIDDSKGNLVALEISRNGKIINITVDPNYSEEYNRYLTGIEITRNEFKETPLYILIPKTVFNTYTGKYDLLLSMKSGLVSLLGLLYGVFQIIVGVGIYKTKKWGLILFLLRGLSYIFTFVGIPAAIYKNGLEFFTNLDYLMPYGYSFIFVVASIYFLKNRKQFK